MKGFVRLENKYGITVKEDDIYIPLNGRTVKRYKMYSADGCLWENGLTRDGVIHECIMWGDTLKKIRQRVKGGKGK